ncbi:hypothetical protein Prudu_010724, partial [Prunus dulcis]
KNLFNFLNFITDRTPTESPAQNRRSISKMEGVGARLGRSSTRYGPATVFTGPVRKWKKKWVHVAPSSNTNNASSTTHHSHQINGHNGTSNGNNGSHLLLYNHQWQWGDKVSAKDDDALEANEEPPRRKFKYIPIALLEEQQLEAAEQVEDESNSIDNEPTETEATPKNEVLDEKPDINDVPMEENEDNNQAFLLLSEFYTSSHPKLADATPQDKQIHHHSVND